MLLLFILFSQISESFLFTGDEMTTTPLLIPVEARTAPANITIFTYEAIEAMGIKTLADLLNLVEGCYTSYSERHIQRVWIRGIGGYYNDRILLLLDGVPLREVVYGHAFIDEYLPLENLERVEIIKGPSSPVYGTNAFAGVINLITRKKFKDCEISGRKGMHQLDEWVGATGYQSNDIKVDLFGKVYQTQGDGQSYSEMGERNRLGEDPVRESAFTGKFSYKQFEIIAGYMNFHHKYPVNHDIPRFIWENNWFHYYTSFVQMHLKAGIFSANAYLQNYNNWSFYQWKVIDTIANTVDYRVTYDVFPIKHSRIYGIEPRFNLEFSALKFVFGGTIERTEVLEVRDLYYNRLTGDTIAPYADTAAGNVYDYWMDPRRDISYSIYGQAIYSSRLFKIIGGGRYDNFLREINGKNLSPRLALSLYPLDWMRIKLLYATAFRNASVRERFIHSTNPSWPSGNPSLIPEKLKTYEAIVRLNLNETKLLKIGVYRNEQSNAIIENKDIGEFVNDSNKLVWKGIELSGMQISGFNEYFLNASYIFTPAEWVPKTSINAGIIYRIRYNYFIVPVIRWVSERKGANKSIPSYFNADITLSRKVGNLWLKTKVTNIFGAPQFDPNIRNPERRDIERPGRQVWIEIFYGMG